MSLTPKEVSVFRSLKKTAIVLLLIYRLDRPVGRNEMASILDLDPSTASNYLKSLSRLGLINRTDYRDGYILTTGGRQLVLGQNLSKALSPVNSGTQDAADNAQKVLQTKAQSPVETGTKDVADSAQQVLSEMIDPQHESKVEISPFQRGFSPLSEEEEESINLIKESSSSSTKVEKFHFQNLPSMAALLNSSHLLFGEGNHVREFGLPARPPEIVLGWLAQAYQDRSKLSRPAGLAYNGIKRGDSPRAQYLEHPEVYLPAEYLQAVGLSSLTPEPEPAESVDELDIIEDAETFPIIEDPSIDRPLGKFTPRKAWQVVLEQLRLEMPRATFDTWVGDTWPARFEEPGLLVVGARSAYVREWLAGRLTSTVSRLLVGLLNRTVEVKFENYE